MKDSKYTKSAAFFATTALFLGCSDMSAPERAVDSLMEEASFLPEPSSAKADGLAPATLRTALKAYVIAVSEANTTRRDNAVEVRALLLPAIALLAGDFAADRPENELDLTRGAWKGIWDDALSIDPPPPIVLDRDNIYQVVDDGFYYNVTNQSFPGPAGLSPTQYFLKGNYTIARPATPDNFGELALNVIDLEFGESVFRPGSLAEDAELVDLVAEINEWVVEGAGVGIPPIAAPGPQGQTGLLFNLYVDEDLRIAAGIDGEDGESLSLFVLRRTTRVGSLPEITALQQGDSQ